MTDEDFESLKVALDELVELLAELRRTLRAINNLCNSPHWTSERRWEIERLSERRQ